MTVEHVLGVAYIAATLVWMAAELIALAREPRRPPVVPKLPTIPRECIDALRARAAEDKVMHARRKEGPKCSSPKSSTTAPPSSSHT